MAANWKRSESVVASDLKLTKTEERLVDKLLEIWNDAEFVAGILAYLESDAERQTMLDYIAENEKATTEDLVLLSLFIDRQRTNK